MTSLSVPDQQLPLKRSLYTFGRYNSRGQKTVLAIEKFVKFALLHRDHIAGLKEMHNDDDDHQKKTVKKDGSVEQESTSLVYAITMRRVFIARNAPSTLAVLSSMLW